MKNCQRYSAGNWEKQLVAFPVWSRWCLSKVLSQFCDCHRRKSCHVDRIWLLTVLVAVWSPALLYNVRNVKSMKIRSSLVTVLTRYLSPWVLHGHTVPALPASTAVVTPVAKQHLSASIPRGVAYLYTWVWTSIKPGVTRQRLASNSCCGSKPRFLPTVSILPLLTATSAIWSTPLAGSSTLPLRIIKSTFLCASILAFSLRGPP